ncbi:MAG: Gx transporter family protein [Lachnospiraceae bacterium]|nr:Gx transporter family protein [Lachnospiraceae bacterium]
MTRLPIKNRLPYLGVLLAFSLILSYVESMIPLPFAVPGVKIGLSNLPVLLCILIIGPADALFLAVLKALLSSLLFGNGTMLIYSLAGALSSCLVMILSSGCLKLHAPAISALGGVFHNLGQMTAAALIMGLKGLFWYLPVLILSGLITGLLLGIPAELLLPRIRKIINKGETI